MIVGSFDRFANRQFFSLEDFCVAFKNEQIFQQLLGCDYLQVVFNLLDAVKKLQAFFYCNDGLSLLSAIADVNIPTYYSKIPQNASHRNSQHEVLSNNKNNKFFRSPATDA